MGAEVLAPPVEIAPRSVVRDLVALGKPRLSSLVICTTAGGLWLAPGAVSWPRALGIIAATAVLVHAANTINSYLERHIDARMLRTKHRPLAAQRLDPRVALVLGTVGAAISLPALVLLANTMTAVLGLLAYVSYVAIYTPLKRVSTWALPVGAIPGAIPPALGYVSVTGELDVAALALFCVLFVWQLPHFLAISVYLKDDYARGGLKVFAVVHGERRAVVAAVASSVALVPTTLALVPLGIATPMYGVVATVLGVGFVGVAVAGLFAKDLLRWARTLFSGSLVYLSLLFVTLAAAAQR